MAKINTKTGIFMKNKLTVLYMLLILPIINQVYNASIIIKYKPLPLQKITHKRKIWKK